MANRFPVSRDHVILSPSNKGKVLLCKFVNYYGRTIVKSARQLTAEDFLMALMPEVVQQAVDQIADQMAAKATARIGAETVSSGVTRFLRQSLRDTSSRVRAAVSAELKESQSAERLATIIAEAVKDAQRDQLSDVKRRLHDHFLNIEMRSRSAYKDLLIRVMREELGVRRRYYDTRKPRPFVKGTRYFFSRGDTSAVVVEQEPQVRTLRFSRSFLTEQVELLDEDPYDKKWAARIERGVVSLAFPRMLFVALTEKGVLKALHVFYLKKPLESLTDKLFSCNLPNASFGDVCLEAFSPAGHMDPMALTERALDYWWESYFNMDDMLEYEEMASRCPSKFATIWDWQRLSEEDPTFVNRVNWRRSTFEDRRTLLVKRRSLYRLVNEHVYDPRPADAYQAEKKAYQVLRHARQIVTTTLSKACLPDPKIKAEARKKVATHVEALGRDIKQRLLEEVDNVSAKDIPPTTLDNLRRELRSIMSETLQERGEITFEPTSVNGDNAIDVKRLVRELGGKA